jgi:hypothetical protein
MTLPVLLICGCRAHEPYLHAAIRRFAHPSWEVIGIVGGAPVSSFDPELRLLQVTAPDTYEALPQKIHAAFVWLAAQRPNAPGVFKTDDDILVTRLQELADAVSVRAAEPYWGFVNHRCHAGYVHINRVASRFTDPNFRPKHQAARYCFGHGYWLSAAALKVAAAATSDYASSYLEDVCTGFVMNRAGYEPQPAPIAYREMPRVPELLRLE